MLVIHTLLNPATVRTFLIVVLVLLLCNYLSVPYLDDSHLVVPVQMLVILLGLSFIVFCNNACLLFRWPSSLTVAETEPKMGPSPTLLAVQGNGTEFQQKRTASPSFLATEMARSRSPTFRSVSPSFRGGEDGTDVNKTDMFNEVLRELGTSGGPDGKSAIYKDLKEGEELEFQGYINPRKQSRTFYLLEKGLAKCDSEPEEGQIRYRRPFPVTYLLRMLALGVNNICCFLVTSLFRLLYWLSLNDLFCCCGFGYYLRISETLLL